MPEQPPQLIGPNVPRDPTMAEVRIVHIQANNIAARAARINESDVVDAERLAFFMGHLHTGEVAHTTPEQRGSRIGAVLTSIFTAFRKK